MPRAADATPMRRYIAPSRAAANTTLDIAIESFIAKMFYFHA